MQGFEFRLSRVLDIRNIKEDIAKNKLHQAQKEAGRTREKLDTLSQTQREVYNYIRNKNKSLSLEERLHSRSYLSNNRRKINEVEERLEERRKKVEEKKQRLVDKRRDRQVLEKLKEEDYKKYYREFQRREQKNLDEISRTIMEGKQGI